MIQAAAPPTYSASAQYEQPVAAPEAAEARQAELRPSEPRIIEAGAARRQEEAQASVRKIVDPDAAEEGDEVLHIDRPSRLAASTVTNRTYTRPGAEPLPDPRQPEPRKSGWLSLFGSRPRYDDLAPAASAPPAQPRPATPAASALKPQSQLDRAEATDDLEIPSFLRRLAN